MKNALRIQYKEAKFNFEWEYKELKYRALQELWTLEIQIYYLLTTWLGWDFNYERDIKNLPNDIKLYDLKLWQYLLEWKSKEDLNSIIANIENNWIQIEWEFEFSNKSYLILYKPKINWDINLSYEQNIEVTNESQNIVWKVEEIL